MRSRVPRATLRVLRGHGHTWLIAPEIEAFSSEGIAMTREKAAPLTADDETTRRRADEETQVAEELRVSGEQLRVRAEKVS